MMKTAPGVKKTPPLQPQIHTIPEILRPANHFLIEESPLLGEWTPNQTNVVKWWLSVGHAPGLDDYFSDEYGPDDELSEKVKIELTGGDVYILLEYQDANGVVGSVRPIIECSTKDKTLKPTHTH
jgi:hypothetical protein